MRSARLRVVIAAALAAASACGHETGTLPPPAAPSSFQVRLLASAETKAIEVGVLRILLAHREMTLSSALGVVRGTPVTLDWALSKPEADAFVAELTAIGAKAEASPFEGTDRGPARPPLRTSSVFVLEIPKGAIVEAAKTIRAHTAFGLAEAAEATKGLPRRVPKDFSRDEADALVVALTAVGVKAEVR